MKRKKLHILLMALMLLPSLLFAQQFQFVTDTSHYTYFRNDTLVEEIYNCDNPYGYELEVEGGDPEYSYNWNLTNGSQVTDDTLLAIPRPDYPDRYTSNICEVTDMVPQTIIKEIQYFDALYVDSLPDTVELANRRIDLFQLPHRTIIEGPGIYFDTLAQQYYLQVDSAGPGIHRVTGRYPNVLSCGGDSCHREYVITNPEPLSIEFADFNLPWNDMNAFCEHESNLSLEYEISGGVESYDVSIDWGGLQEGWNPAGQYWVEYTISDTLGETIADQIEVHIEGAYISGDPDFWWTEFHDYYPEVLYTTDEPFYVDVYIQEEYLLMPPVLQGSVDWNPVEHYSVELWDPYYPYSFYINPSELGVGYHTLDLDLIGWSGCMLDWQQYYFEIVDTMQLTEFYEELVYCEGDILDLHTEVIGGALPLSYSWSVDGETVDADGADFSYVTEFLSYDNLVQCTVTDYNGMSVTKDFFVNASLFNVDYPNFPATMRQDEGLFMFGLENGQTIEGEAIGSSGSAYYIDPSLLSMGEYVYTITTVDSYYGCVQTEDFVITVENEPLSIVGNDYEEISVCFDTYELLTVQVEGGVEPYTYNWNVNDTYEPITENSIWLLSIGAETMPASVTCEIEDATGATVIKTWMAMLYAEIDLSIVEFPDTVFTTDDPILIAYGQEGVEYMADGDGIVYEGGSAYFDPSTRTPGEYNFVIMASWNGECMVYKSIDVVVAEQTNEPLELVGAHVEQTHICFDEQIELGIHTNGGVAPLSYSWEISEAYEPLTDSTVMLFGIINDPRMEYIICVVEDANGDTVSKVWEVEYLEAIIVDPTDFPDTLYTTDASVLIDFGQDRVQYMADGDGIIYEGNNAYFDPSTVSVGNHNFVVMSSIGDCMTHTSIDVVVVEEQTGDGLSIIGTANEQLELCYADTTMLEVHTTGGEEPLNYEWTGLLGTGTTINDSLAWVCSLVEISTIQTVTCIVTDANGQTATKEFEVLFRPELIEDQSVLPDTLYVSDDSVEITMLQPEVIYNATGTGLQSINDRAYFFPAVAGAGVHARNLYYSIGQCSDYTTFVITVLPDPVNEFSLVGDDTEDVFLCFNDILDITVETAGGVAPLTYNWEINESFEPINDSTIMLIGDISDPRTSQITCEVEDATGATVIKTWNVDYAHDISIDDTLFPDTLYRTDAPVLIDFEQYLVQYSAYGEGVINEGGDFYFDPSALTDGVYTFTAFANYMQCEDIAYISVVVIDDTTEPLQRVGDLVVHMGYCEGDVLDLELIVTGGVEPISYAWTVDGVLNSETRNVFNYAPDFTSPYNYVECVATDMVGDTVSKIFYINASDLFYTTYPEFPEMLRVGETPFTFELAANQSVSGAGLVLDGSEYILDPTTMDVGEYEYTIFSTDYEYGCIDTFRTTIEIWDDQPGPLSFEGPEYEEIAICFDDIEDISLQVVEGTGPFTYEWNVDLNYETLSENSIRLYSTYYDGINSTVTCTVFDAYGVSATKTWNVTMNPEIVVDAAMFPDTVYTSDDAILIDFGQTGIDYMADGSGIIYEGSNAYFDPSLLTPGHYDFVAMSSIEGDCMIYTTIEVVVTEEAIEPLSLYSDIASNFDVCFGEQVEIDVHIAGGVAPYSYEWNSGEELQLLTDSTVLFNNAINDERTSSVMCIVTDAAGQTATIERFMYMMPEIVIDESMFPATFYTNDEPVIIDFGQEGVNYYAEGDGVVVVPDDPFYVASFVPSFLDPGMYQFIVTGLLGRCEHTEIIEVEIIEQPLPLTISRTTDDNVNVCPNQEIQQPLVFTPVGGVPYADGTYNMSVNGINIGRVAEYETVISTTNLICLVTDSLGNTAQDTIFVNVYPSNQVSLYNAEIFEGDEHTFTTEPANYEYYQWNTGSEDAEIIASEAGEYSVTVTDENGCTYSDRANLTVIPRCTLRADFTVELVGGSNNEYRFVASGADSYVWNLPDGTVTTESEFIHTFDDELEGSVCLSVTEEQCVDTRCETYHFYSPEIVYTISGSVLADGDSVDCGMVITYKMVDTILVAVDTVAIDSNGNYTTHWLTPAEYTVRAVPCEEYAYVATYYVDELLAEDATMIDLIGNATSVDISLIPREVSVDESEFDGILNVYPNPMKSRLTIECEFGSVIMISDILGKVVQTLDTSKGQYKLTDKDLTPGIYIVSMLKDNVVVAYKRLIVSE